MEIPLDKNILQQMDDGSCDYKCSCGNIIQVQVNYPDLNQLKAKADLFDILESLPKGWDWSLSGYRGQELYYCVIRCDGLVREPCYSTGDCKGRRDTALNCVKDVYAAYLEGEAKAQQLTEVK